MGPTEDTRFRILTEVSQQITSILDINALLEQIARLIQRTFDYYHVGIGLIEGDEVVYRVGAGRLWDQPGFAFRPSRLKLGSQGITGWVAGTGQPAVVPDVSRDARYVWMQGSLTRSELIVPIKVKGATIGVLDAQSERLDDFGTADLELMQSLASQAGVAIENARLFASLERKAEQFRVLTVVSQHISSLTTLHELLENIARTVKTAFGYLHVGIGLVDGAEVVSMAEAGAFEDAYRSVRIPLGEGIWGRVAQSGEPLLWGPLEENSARPHVHAAGDRSHVCVPLKVKGVVVGVISAAGDPEAVFDQSDLMILQTLANQTSVAIENVRLHEQEKRTAVVEERQRLARDLHDSVTQSLYGMGLHAQAAAREIALQHPQQASKYLMEISDTSEQAMAEMRLLLYQLRPPVLEKEGLAAALQARLAAVESRAGQKAELKTNLTSRLPPAVEAELYYIAQEALNNVLKHAHAASITVSLLRNGADVCLEVADDGVGFDAAQVSLEGRMGLQDMRQRATGLGGELTISSTPGRGTRVRVELTV